MIINWDQIAIWSAKLLLAAVLGGTIGFERETHGQSAGFRTNTLVALGACLMMMLSLHMEELYRHLDEESVVRLDPGRIASYAIASIGFLGAGAIIKGKGTVRGLTTAAGLWMVTAIGLAVGAGYFLPALFAAIISLLILYNLRFFKLFFSHDIYTILCVTCRNSTKPLKTIREILAEYPTVEVRFVNYEQSIATQMASYRIRLYSKEDLPWGQIVGRLSTEIIGVEKISWEESDVP